MVDICTITFTTRDTLFTLLPGQVVVFRPTGPQLDSAGSVLRVRKAVSVTANGAGAATIALIPGPYLLEAQVDGKLTSVPCTVPDQATATIDDCIAAVTAEAYGALAIAALAIGLRLYPSANTAEADPTLPFNSGFLAPHIPSGVTLGVWRKFEMSPGIAQSLYVGPLFPAAQFLPGTLGAPGLGVQGDGDTGLYSPAANQLAAAAGGVLGWLLSTTGLQINQPVTGLAVTQSRTDTTAGRLLKVGDFGLGLVTGAGGAALADIDVIGLARGFYETTSATLGDFPAGENRFGHLTVLRYDANNFAQLWMSALSDTLYTRRYRSTDVPAFSPWRPLFSRHNILGTVSQTGGVPTGRVIERGSNANGEYVRFADGTQICTRTNLSAPNANTALGSLFRSADVAWTYPIAFAAAPAVQGDVDDGDCWLTTSGAPGTASVNVRALAAVTKGSALTLRATAVGRWF